MEDKDPGPDRPFPHRGARGRMASHAPEVSLLPRSVNTKWHVLEGLLSTIWFFLVLFVCCELPSSWRADAIEITLALELDLEFDFLLLLLFLPISSSLSGWWPPTLFTTATAPLLRPLPNPLIRPCMRNWLPSKTDRVSLRRSPDLGPCLLSSQTRKRFSALFVFLLLPV